MTRHAALARPLVRREPPLQHDADVTARACAGERKLAAGGGGLTGSHAVDRLASCASEQKTGEEPRLQARHCSSSQR